MNSMRRTAYAHGIVSSMLRSSHCKPLFWSLPICGTKVDSDRRGFTHRLLASRIAPDPMSDA